MIAYAVYIISVDGRPIVSEKFQSADTIPNEFLLGGLFTALEGVAAEMSNAESTLNSINIDNLSYHFKSFGQYKIVLVTDLTETPDNVLHTLGLRFMQEHGEDVIDGFIDISLFKPFIKTIHEVLSNKLTIDETKMINPTKKITSSELYNLPVELQATAIAIIGLKEGKAEEIASEIDENVSNAEMKLNQLQKMGYIGQKTINEDVIYFISI